MHAHACAHAYAWVCVRMCDCAHVSVCACTVQNLRTSFGVSVVVVAAVYTNV